MSTELVMDQKYTLRSKVDGRTVIGIYAGCDLHQVKEMPSIHYWLDWFEVPSFGKTWEGEPRYVMVDQDDESSDYGWEIIGKC